MSTADKTLERIAALLNQAENTDSKEERDAFMTKAQTLATIHSLDLARARSHTRSKENSTPVQKTVKVGEARQQGNRVRVDLFIGIAEANDIEVTIARNATRVYAHGFQEDIDTAEALYASLVLQMAQASDRWLDTGEHKNETIYRKVRKVDDEWEERVFSHWDNETGKAIYKTVKKRSYYDSYEMAPVPTKTARLEFQAAFRSEVQHRLWVAKREAEGKVITEEKRRRSQPHLDDQGYLTPEFQSWFDGEHNYAWGEDREFDADLSAQLVNCEDEWAAVQILAYRAYLEELSESEPGTELVLVQKRKEVNDFYKKQNPHLFKGRVGGYRGHESSGNVGSARQAGAQAGRNARLGGQGSIGGTRGAIGR